MITMKSRIKNVTPSQHDSQFTFALGSQRLPIDATPQRANTCLSPVGLIHSRTWAGLTN